MDPITDTPDAPADQPHIVPDEERLYRLSYQPLLWGESPEDETPEEKVKLSLNREQFYGVLCAFDILLACDNDPDELLQRTDLTNGQELEAQYLTEYSPYLLGSVMSPTAAEAFPSPVSRDKADELREKAGGIDRPLTMPYTAVLRHPQGAVALLVQFQTEDFMQGFITACSLLKVDYTQCYRDLTDGKQFYTM